MGVEFGIVGYTHAGGVDRPLVAYKTNGGNSGAVVVPHMNWRGLFSLGTNPSGGASTVVVEWPGFRTTAYHSQGETQSTTKNWMGSLLEGQRDAGGLMYMRNRYYDPATGQFTQTDPIGLGGGLNTYGYAAGDPVSYSDPYGLCKVEVQFTPAGMIGKHAAIITTEPDGTATAWDAGPENGQVSSAVGASGGSGGSSSEASGSNSPSSNSSSPGAGESTGSGDDSLYGHLEAKQTPYVPRKKIYQPGAPRTVLVNDNNSCDQHTSAFRTAMQSINGANIVYSPFTTNSNAAARWMLRSAGLDAPPRRMLLPGWNRELPIAGGSW